MSLTITPAATLALRDTSLSDDPNQIPFAGCGVVCPLGAISQDVVLPSNTTGAALPKPTGLTTAKVVAIYPGTCPDLVVTYNGQALAVPVQQPFFLYNVTLSLLTIGSTLGGQITTVVGG